MTRVSAGKRSHFTVWFIAAIAIAGVATFFLFTYVARREIALRRETSKNNLLAMSVSLRSFQRDARGGYPVSSHELYERLFKPENAINPSWPEETGYIVVTGVRPDDEPSTILIYENTPEAKKKIGRFVLRKGGEIELLNDADFAREIRAQEERWTKSKRTWRPEGLAPAPVR